jgi:hypothetical protein
VRNLLKIWLRLLKLEARVILLHIIPVEGDGIPLSISILSSNTNLVHSLRTINGVTKVFPHQFPHNVDLDPILPQNRTWRTYNYIAYWASDAFVVSIWQMASAFLASGLNWQLSLGAVALGFVLIAIPITLQGTMGARLNIPFPILVRGSFGMNLSYFCIVSRSILAMFWFGISTATGGTLTVQCIRAIWPRFSNVSNQLPASANITTQGMIGYFVLYFRLPLIVTIVSYSNFHFSSFPVRRFDGSSSSKLLSFQLPSLPSCVGQCTQSADSPEVPSLNKKPQSPVLLLDGHS